jgi:hypothetical protein
MKENIEEHQMQEEGVIQIDQKNGHAYENGIQHTFNGEGEEEEEEGEEEEGEEEQEENQNQNEQIQMNEEQILRMIAEGQIPPGITQEQLNYYQQILL